MSSIDSAINSVLEIQSADTQQQIAYALLAKSREAAKQQAAAAVELLNSAAKVQSSGRAPDKGLQLDALL